MRVESNALSTNRAMNNLTPHPRSIHRLVLNLRGREWQHFTARQRDRTVDHCFRYWRARGFPFYYLSDEEISVEYSRVESAVKETIIVGNEIRMSMSGV